MPYSREYPEEDDFSEGDLRDEADDPQPEDLDDDDDHEEDQVRCPACERYVLEESEVCPHCGGFIMKAGTFPIWVRIVAVVTLLAFLLVYALWP